MASNKSGYIKKKGLSRTRSMGAAVSSELGINPTGNIIGTGIGGGPGKGRADAAYSKSNLYSRESHPGKPKSVGMKITKGKMPKF